jgi:CBS domain-containing protein
VTSWDVTKAVAEGKRNLAEIIVRKVVTTTPNESLEEVSRELAQHNISALPVIDRHKKVVGIITSEDISKLLGR